jgi:hypothetical protein
MKRLVSLGAVASLASWMCIGTFFFGAFRGSSPLLVGGAVLALASIGLDAILIRRKLKAKSSQ